jgi:uncharacterized membrane protein YphA (DoxX/SURF4 family)
MANTLTILSCVLGLFFTAAGLNKLTGTHWAIDQSQRDGFPPYTYHGSGIIEIIAGPLLFVPRLRFVGVMSLLIMIALLELASFSKTNRPPLPLHLRIPAVITEVLLLGLAWRTWPY